ncbi:MAG TPA: FtsX-like permease family protein [Myxococcota bacterium]|nr:FtsX-like permease family protein [Myxococcota bacterium]
MPSLPSLAWRDLRGAGRQLWVFCACLALGVALIAATGGLFHQVRAGMLADMRTLMGGDLEVRSNQPLGAPELGWMRARGGVSLLLELRTMLGTRDGRAQLVELQSFDERYPLYGRVELDPPAPLQDALAARDGTWGAAIDPVLADRLALGPGDRVNIGRAELAVRAVVARQPDRSLRASWSGPPVLISREAFDATGLLRPGSRAEYRYRVRIAGEPDGWRDQLVAAFPDAQWEVRTFGDRGQRLGRVLDQVASGLLLIAFSALFIGGLGVFNSVHAYLQGKLATIALLKSLGLRDRRIAWVYLLQVLLLAGGASLAGAAAGGLLALGAAAVSAERFPIALTAGALAAPLASAWLFGILTALGFALPALGRALSVSPAILFRGLDDVAQRTPRRYWLLAAATGACLALLLAATVPDPRFSLGFVASVALVVALLDLVVRLLRRASRRLSGHPRLEGRFVARLALANLHRPGSPLRTMLLSLGSALTLLVACALVVAALLQAVNDTIPQRAPSLVFYDIAPPDLPGFRTLALGIGGMERVDLLPLVQGRIERINGVALRDSGDRRLALEARDEHKLSYRGTNADDVLVKRGAWWPEGYAGPPLVAMEDREAEQLGLALGDRLQFDVAGRALQATVAAIYSQRRFQTRYWLEGIFSDGALEGHITRYVGAAYLAPGTDGVAALNRIAAGAPGVGIVRTEGALAEARALLARAGGGLAVIAGLSLAASLLVLASVVASARSRQAYDATLLHTLGARIEVIRRSLCIEFFLLATITSAFAIVFGSALALALLEYRLQLESAGVLWVGAVTAVGVSGSALALGARHLLRQLRLAPALLLRGG